MFVLRIDERVDFSTNRQRDKEKERERGGREGGREIKYRVRFVCANETEIKRRLVLSTIDDDDDDDRSMERRDDVNYIHMIIKIVSTITDRQERQSCILVTSWAN